MFDSMPNRILSIDPGMKSFGVTISEMVNGKLVIMFVHTFDIDRVVKLRCSQMRYTHGEREAKRAAIQITVSELLLHWQPFAVAVEAAHFKGIVNAYRSLIECITCVQTTVLSIAPHLSFDIIPASVVKATVGVNGQSKDKNAVRDALPLVHDLDLNGINVLDLDEHSTDSIAINYTFYHTFVKGRFR